MDTNTENINPPGIFPLTVTGAFLILLSLLGAYILQNMNLVEAGDRQVCKILGMMDVTDGHRRLWLLFSMLSGLSLMVGAGLVLVSKCIIQIGDRLVWTKECPKPRIEARCQNKAALSVPEKQFRSLFENSIELRRIVTMDPLTQINNRRHFLVLTQTEIIRARHYGHPFSLMMLDIDHLKKINDTHGHSVGDRVLRECCDICLNQMGENNIMGRLGGDGFGITLPECNAENAERLAERIRSAISTHRVIINRKAIHFTVSIGIAEFYPDDRRDAIIERACCALYQAQKKGRDQVRVAINLDRPFELERMNTTNFEALSHP